MKIFSRGMNEGFGGLDAAPMDRLDGSARRGPSPVADVRVERSRAGRRPTSLVALTLAVVAGISAGCEGGHAVLRDAPTDTLVSINGTRLWVHLETGGEAESASIGSRAIVVVHGGPLLDHGYLVDPLRPLAEVAPLVFYDQRLSGRSDGVTESEAGTPALSLATFVDDIEALRVELGLDRIHLLGHSWGGGLAMRYALAHPQRVASLILVSPTAPSFDLAEREARAGAASLEAADTAGMGALRASDGLASGDPAMIERLLRMSFRSQLVDRALADELTFEIPDDYMARSGALSAIGAELAASDLTAGLRGLDVPTLVVYGDAEPAAALTGPAFDALLPDASVEVIDGAKHFAFLERPEAFRSVVVEFLAGL